MAMSPQQPTPPDRPAGPVSLGILGAGRAGTALARAARSAGIPVRIAASRPPQALRLHLAQYAPRATAVPAAGIAGSPGDASGARPLVVLMVPQEDLDTVDPNWVRGTVLVDATNRWADEPLPGWFEDALRQGRSSSEALALRFPGAAVVKALNHISHWDLDTAARGAGTERRGLAVAGDDAGAVRQVADLTRHLGFDPVVLPGLAAGRALEPDGPVFNQPLSASGLRRALGLTDA
jgi:predicted dinucleotide-binding enzyme